MNWQRVVAKGEVLHGEKMLYSGTDPESYTTEYTGVYEGRGRQFLSLMACFSSENFARRSCSKM